MDFVYLILNIQNINLLILRLKDLVKKFVEAVRDEETKRLNLMLQSYDYYTELSKIWR